MTNLVRVGSEVSTREILAKELYLIRSVSTGIESVAPITNRYEPPDRLGPDQRKVLAHVLTSPDRSPAFAAWPVPAKAPPWSNWRARSATGVMIPFSVLLLLPPRTRSAKRCPIWPRP
jgi:hypothetical protein